MKNGLFLLSLLFLSSCSSLFIPKDYPDCPTSDKVPASYTKDFIKSKVLGYEGVYYRQKINLKRLEQLEKHGVNFKKKEKYHSTFHTYTEKALLADAIIHGKVIEVKFDTIDTEYHFTFKVKIKDVLKGRFFVLKGRFLRKHKFVYLKSKAISIENRSTHRSKFEIGENALMYFAKPIKDKMTPFIASPSRYLKATLDLDAPSTFFYFAKYTIKKYAIRASYVPRHSKNIHIAKWKIRQVVRIHGKDNFCEVYPSD